MLDLGRNALAISVSALTAYLWTNSPFRLTGTVRSGLPNVMPPPFWFPDPASNSTEPMTFTETLGFMGAGPITVASVSILQNVAIIKAFGSGQTIDGTREMIALGTTNNVGGFFSCCPSSESFSPSALNDASRVKTQMNGRLVGSLILLFLSTDKVNKTAQRYSDYPVMVFQCDTWTQWDYNAASSMVTLGKNSEKT